MKTNSEQQGVELSQAGLSSGAPNYGTMDSAENKHISNQQQVNSSTTSEKPMQPIEDSTTHSSPSSAEPPQPAVRRKIHTLQNNKETQDLDMADSGSKRHDEQQNDKKFSNSLPSPQDFSKQNEHESAKSLQNHPCKRAYPKQVAFIVANEFCERFSYYGLRTVMVLYFKSVLGFTDSASTVSFHLFATLCYLMPIFGAILGDSIWGKYKTILYLSVVYFIGEFVLVLSSVFWQTSFVSGASTLVGLIMIGVGTGGIKPCVSAFGGDQFHAHETRWRESFFSIFYAAINLGSLISMFLTPMLRSNFQCVQRADCYPYAFGLPCAIMLVSILLFVAAHQHYTIAPLPERNVIVAFCQCVWLAFRRNLSGARPGRGAPDKPEHLADAKQQQQVGQLNRALIPGAGADSASNSSVSLASSGGAEEQLVKVVSTATSDKQPVVGGRERDEQQQGDTKHWLYLASDKFDAKSIEDFRCVLAILLLFLPTPVYWCLFDQQGSLWTLQATRMDGRVPATQFVLEPDQMMVANPLLLLLSIAMFQLLFYPCLNRCNILQRPIPRMTTGGLIAAAAFVSSALIEFHIQAHLPPEVAPVGHSSVLLVNGLGDCAIVGPQIAAKNTSHTAQQVQIEPLESLQIDVPTTLGNAHLRFELANSAPRSVTSVSGAAQQTCSFDLSQPIELAIGSVAPQGTSKLLYIGQGNGKVTHKLFNETLVLPPPGTAKVRLLFEYFGSSAQALKRRFSLVRKDSENNLMGGLEQTFHLASHDGQVQLSEYIDVPIASARGIEFKLKMLDNSGTNQTHKFIQGAKGAQEQVILLQPGTRNLIIVHQRDSKTFEFNHELLQDNKYRVSMLWQLIPYYLISTSEVMFSITGLEFSYSMAPSSMKSLILGAWFLFTALGNILTVAVESLHPFGNMAHDFLFYATIMVLDMFVFALIGYHYKPYNRK